jgi:hypothetical protein
LGKNIMDLTQDELSRARADPARPQHGGDVDRLARAEMCAAERSRRDTRFQQDIFASKHTFKDQPRLTDHAFEVAKFFGAKIIRVFSYWRTVDRRSASTRLRGLRTISRTKLRRKPDHRDGERARLQHRHGGRIGEAAECGGAPRI